MATTAAGIQQIEETRPLLSREQQEDSTATARHLRSLGTTGLFVMLLSSFAHSCASVAVKWSSSTFPSFEIVFARSLFQTLLGLVGCLWVRANPLGPPGVRRWIVFSGLLGTLGAACLYYSLSNLPLAETTIVIYLYPTLTAIMAALFLGEPFGWWDTLSATLCMVGAVLVFKPYILFGSSSSKKQPSNDGSNNTAIAALTAILCVFFASSAYTAVRKVGTRTHFFSLTFVTGCFLCLVSLLVALFGFQAFVFPHDLKSWMKFISIGIASSAQQCLANLGVQLAPAGSATLMCMNDIIFAFIFGILLFDEYPDAISIIGAILIIVMTSSVVAINK
ncbi:EamA-like transporter family-domain-containing protein [Zychaea mexicana]|uniref:EamA-like transporter family-domain-containing protein n=1 Tax=Zychaea mexicana TaxID=64656 RepID=UPI0022FDFDB2|nr:EamA-like transporter family-domain-containing protein [Zychaea mexicana]KAI9491495.1 EamA-like transporter family-domain-containing protein [Zychaea mexicana]